MSKLEIIGEFIAAVCVMFGLPAIIVLASVAMGAGS